MPNSQIWMPHSLAAKARLRDYGVLVDDLRGTTIFGAIALPGGKVQSAKLKSDGSTLKVLLLKVQATKFKDGRKINFSPIKSCTKSKGFIQAEADSQAGNLSLKF